LQPNDVCVQQDQFRRGYFQPAVQFLGAASQPGEDAAMEHIEGDTFKGRRKPSCHVFRIRQSTTR
jgi:hypothetical protein